MFAHTTSCLVLQGTIVEWLAQLGEAVKDGDVIAMVETDKVTIDIKAEMDGVITQHFGAV
jgi:pyruvate/2-oxoglutarate dehydrogenase complex dihydrolipoamide acyltransferase (E2) component